MRKTIIAGNWKLNKTIKQTIELITEIKRGLHDEEDVDVVVCPVFTALADAHDLLVDSPIRLGAQNLYQEDSGAFTGEVSAPLIKEAGASYVIVGHSERREYFGETNELVNRKLKAALRHDLIPIVCVGEVLQERESGQTFDVIQKQCEESLAGLTPEQMARVIIAYEPVWAIGTGKTASPQQAQQVHQFIRQLMEKQFNRDTAQKLRIQYGGSVKPENSAQLMAQPDIDGALVGGASLQADSFVAIVKNSRGVASA